MIMHILYATYHAAIMPFNPVATSMLWSLAFAQPNPDFGEWLLARNPHRKTRVHWNELSEIFAGSGRARGSPK